jgi:hypothetical protein
MAMKNAIEYVVEGSAPISEEQRQEWQHNFGEDPYRQIAYYRNLETDEKYHHLAGGFAWPGRKAGFALVLAAMRGPVPVKFKVIEEVEDMNVESLILKCAGLRERYSPPNDISRPLTIYGNLNHRLNGFLHGIPDDKRFWLTSPIEFYEAKGTLELFANRIESTGREGRLDLTQSGRLKRYLADTPDSFVGEREEDHPAVAALGYALHSLAKSEPWILRDNIGSYIDE